MRIAVYPGSFDPVTWGHIDIIKRALRLFDKVIVAVGENPEKTPLFNIDERVFMLNESCKGIGNVEIKPFSSLLSDFVVSVGAVAIIRGLRAVSDFDYEFQLALANRKLAPLVETIFLLPDERFVYLNSTLVKSIARYNGKLDEFVPPVVKRMLKERFLR